MNNKKPQHNENYATWGGAKDTLKKIHRHLIRAKIDYAVQ